MSVIITCPGCKSSLRIRDEYAGKQLKCPRCSEIVQVPVGAAEGAAPPGVPEVAQHVEEVRPGPHAAPPPVPRHAGASTAVEQGRPPARPHAPPREEDYDDEEVPRRRKPRKEYKPCPRCGTTGARRVTWTPWGSFYGPAMCTHVCCPGCGYCYNGRTGRSNIVPIIIFLTIPILLLIGINVALFFAFRNLAPIALWILYGVEAVGLLVWGIISLVRAVSGKGSGHD